MHKTLATTLVVSALVVGGCSTLNPYTGESQRSKAVTGAAAGAIGGAIIGIATADSAKERKRRALIGAGAGAIAGGSAGVYMDNQEAKLREKLETSGVSVTRDGENIILNMPGNITFGSNESVLRSDFLPVLDSVSEVLKEFKSTMIQVGGHTDSTGSEQYNMLLSQQRAQSVTNALMRFGVDQLRIDTVGFGQSQPIASNANASSRGQNRRVELILLPIKQ